MIEMQAIQQWIPVVGFSLALLMALFVLYLWQNSQALARQLKEMMALRLHFEREAQDRVSEKEVLTEKIQRLQTEGQKLRDQLQRQQGERRQQSLRVDQVRQEYEDQILAAERQKDILSQQNDALTKQMQEMDFARTQLQAQWNELESRFQEKVREQQQNAQRQVQALSSEMSQLKKDHYQTTHLLRQSEERLSKYDPNEVHKLKRKLAQSEHLILSMRGLKELAEERCQNWEIALDQLAHHVLRESTTRPGKGKVELGTLVARALESIGGRLMDEADDIAADTGMITPSTSELPPPPERMT